MVYEIIFLAVMNENIKGSCFLSGRCGRASVPTLILLVARRAAARLGGDGGCFTKPLELKNNWNKI